MFFGQISVRSHSAIAIHTLFAIGIPEWNPQTANKCFLPFGLNPLVNRYTRITLYMYFS